MSLAWWKSTWIKREENYEFVVFKIRKKRDINNTKNLDESCTCGSKTKVMWIMMCYMLEN